jgi:hypothetical protein
METYDGVDVEINCNREITVPDICKDITISPKPEQHIVNKMYRSVYRCLDLQPEVLW